LYFNNLLHSQQNLSGFNSRRRKQHNSMTFTIKQPSNTEEFKRYYQLRWQLLRAPWKQPQGSEIDALEEQCFHVMAINDNDEVIGVARLQFNSATEAQIRYMAVSKSHERQGIGRALITAMEDHAMDSHMRTIVLDAREAAVGFYQRLGYRVIEKSYLLFDEIQHFRMIKNLAALEYAVVNSDMSCR
jgi:predicted GNAT family N-acyltransferase